MDTRAHFDRKMSATQKVDTNYTFKKKKRTGWSKS